MFQSYVVRLVLPKQPLLPLPNQGLVDVLVQLPELLVYNPIDSLHPRLLLAPPRVPQQGKLKSTQHVCLPLLFRLLLLCPLPPRFC